MRRSSDASQRRHTVGLASATPSITNLELPVLSPCASEGYRRDGPDLPGRTAGTLRNILTPLREGIKTRNDVHTLDCM
jgi:hypothetical protein